MKYVLKIYYSGQLLFKKEFDKWYIINFQDIQYLQRPSKYWKQVEVQ